VATNSQPTLLGNGTANAPTHQHHRVPRHRLRRVDPRRLDRARIHVQGRMNTPPDGRIPPVLPSFTAQVLKTRLVTGSGPLLTQPSLPPTALAPTGRPSGARVTCGPLGADVSKAVEIISLRRQIRGSAAYKMLKETAESADLSVRDMARVVLHAPEIPHQGAPS